MSLAPGSRRSAASAADRGLASAPAKLAPALNPWWVLSLEQMALAIACWVWFQWPIADVRPEGIELWLGTAHLIMSILTFTLGPRIGVPWIVGTLLLTATGCIALTATRPTETGVVTVGVVAVVTMITGALYLDRGPLLGLGAYVVAGYACASVFGLAGIHVVPLLVVVGTMIGGTVLVHDLIRTQRLLLERLEIEARRDPLTGVLNRRGAEQEAEVVRSVAARSGSSPTTVVVIDLDDFKGYNDKHGHLKGDDLLQSLTRDWSEGLRVGDVLARIGGDEFLLVLPDTDEHMCAAVLARLRSCNDVPWSAGAALWRGSEPLDDAVRRADRLMYEAKNTRRTRQLDIRGTSAVSGAVPPEDH